MDSGHGLKPHLIVIGGYLAPMGADHVEFNMIGAGDVEAQIH